MDRNKIGLALSSGSARGLAHIGVIKTLIKNNISIDYIAGSSAGAIVGAYFALYGEIDSLEKLLLENSKEFMPIFLDLGISEGFVNGEKLTTFLKKVFKNKEFKDTKIPLYIISTDLMNCKSIIFSSGKLAHAIRGSISVPIVFKPYKDQDELLVDGGLSNPVPANILKDKGADKIISVNLYPKNKFDKKIKISNIALRTFYVGLHFLSKMAIPYSNIWLEPKAALNINNIKLSNSLKPENIKKLIATGEKEALDHLDEIKKLVK